VYPIGEGGNKMREYKYRDKNHPPVPQLKVGDICYTRSQYTRGYADISTCEIRKVEVVWHEANKYSKDDYGHWSINYYIRTDIDSPELKSTKMYSYSTGEDGSEADLFFTPQEVMDKNISDFRDMVLNTAQNIRKTMMKLGYTPDQMSKLFEYKN